MQNYVTLTLINIHCSLAFWYCIFLFVFKDIGNSPSFTAEQVVNLKRPLLDLDVLPSSGITNVTFLVSLLDGGAILAHKEGTEQHVTRVDRRGNPVSPSYTCLNDNIVQGLVVTGKYLYILQSNGTLTKCYNQDLQKTVQIHRIESVGCVFGGVLTSASQLILSDFEWGEVFCYDLETNFKRTLVTALDKPISVAYDRSRKRFAVCEYWGNCVRLYDSGWNIFSTIGGDHGDGDGELYSPSCVVFSPNGSLFIADKYNDRVSEFSQDGRFLRHVITARDGIKEPVSLSCTYPHIWVTCNYGNNVKRFKVFE